MEGYQNSLVSIPHFSNVYIFTYRKPCGNVGECHGCSIFVIASLKARSVCNFSLKSQCVSS